MQTFIYLSVWVAVIFLMARFGCGAHMMGHGHKHHDAHNQDKQKEPVV